MSKHPTPEHYQRRVGDVLLDPYRIARAYGLEDHALFSALKKILAAGRRGAKDTAHDVQDAIDALVRWQELEREDATPEPATAALEGDDPTDEPTVRDLARLFHRAGLDVKFSIQNDKREPMPAARIAELERERDEAREELGGITETLVASGLAQDTSTESPLAAVERVAAELVNANEAAAEDDEARNELDDWKQRHKKCCQGMEAQRREANAYIGDLRRDLDRVRAAIDAHQKKFGRYVAARDHVHAVETALEHFADLRTMLNVEQQVADDNDLCATLDTERQAAVATAEELERVRKELAALRDRYRPRRQSEEPAPVGMVLKWGVWSENWELTHWRSIKDGDIWTHQPPAPGEGEALEGGGAA